MTFSSPSPAQYSHSLKALGQSLNSAQANFPIPIATTLAWAQIALGQLAAHGPSFSPQALAQLATANGSNQMGLQPGLAKAQKALAKWPSILQAQSLNLAYGLALAESQLWA